MTTRTIRGALAALLALFILGLAGGTALADASGQAGQCAGYNDPANTKVDTSDGSIVLPAGLTVCLKAGNGNTGAIATDGVTTIAEYIEASGLLNNGGQVPNISNYVVYGAAATPTPEPTEEATPTPAPSTTPEPSGTPEPTAEPSEQPVCLEDGGRSACGPLVPCEFYGTAWVKVDGVPVQVVVNGVYDPLGQCAGATPEPSEAPGLPNTALDVGSPQSFVLLLGVFLLAMSAMALIDRVRGR